LNISARQWQNAVAALTRERAGVPGAIAAGRGADRAFTEAAERALAETRARGDDSAG
jgi:hypothetical protein